jgi:hypothetical protein
MLKYVLSIDTNRWCIWVYYTKDLSLYNLYLAFESARVFELAKDLSVDQMNVMAWFERNKGKPARWGR